MANGSDEKIGTPALGDVPTAWETEAAVREAAVPSSPDDNPKSHGGKPGNAVREVSDATGKDKA